MKDHPETFPEAALETYVGVLRARDMIERGQLVSARNLLESIRHPDRSSWDLLARVQLRQGDYDGALMAWEKAGECGMDPAKISQCLKALESYRGLEWLRRTSFGLLLGIGALGLLTLATMFRETSTPRRS